MSAVEVRDVFRVYSEGGSGVAALQGLTLDVREGEICVVLGPSGSGKTTLLRLLAGLDRPSAGTVRVHGLDVGLLRRGALVRYRRETLGYAEQQLRRALAEELTARELVGLQLGLAGAPWRERAARADELLERVGLANRRDAHPGQLSGGEQQRVAVAAALAHRPRLFLADEPTGELDAGNAAAVFAVIGELVRETGGTAVIVSHDPQSAGIADRIVRVRDGRVSEEVARTEDDDTIVVGKGGWLRLSEEMLRRAGIGVRASARVADGGIVLSGVGEEPATAPVEAPAPTRRIAFVRRARPPLAAELRRVTRRFAEGTATRTVLDEVSARFAPGRLHAVMGPSGSGKTTLLHVVAGIDVPDGGDVAVGDTVVSALDRAARAAFRREHVGFVGQEPGLVPFLTARENVEFGLALRGLAGDVDETLAAVGLEERADQRVLHLSAGERERVAVARALAPRPALLLADEPTSRLDQANALALAVLFARLARETGATVVCATHDPIVVEQADEILPLAGESSVQREATPAAVRRL